MGLIDIKLKDRSRKNVLHKNGTPIYYWSLKRKLTHRLKQRKATSIHGLKIRTKKEKQRPQIGGYIDRWQLRFMNIKNSINVQIPIDRLV